MRKPTATPLTAGMTTPFTPPSLLGDPDASPPREPHKTLSTAVFYISQPTFAERDEIGVLIYRMNVRQISTDNIRALMISECFEIYPDDEAEDIAVFLEAHWQLSNLDNQDMMAWQEQEIQRLLDIKDITNPKKHPKQKPLPEIRTKIRDRARADLIVQEIVDKSQRVRNKLADQQLYDVRFRNVTVRIQLGRGGWSGLKCEPEFDDSLGVRIVTEAAIEKLRTELQSVPAAWFELAEECSAAYDLPETERKNSDSPPLSGLAPDGSTSGSGESATKGGNGTE